MLLSLPCSRVAAAPSAAFCRGCEAQRYRRPVCISDVGASTSKYCSEAEYDTLDSMPKVSSSEMNYCSAVSQRRSIDCTLSYSDSSAADYSNYYSSVPTVKRHINIKSRTSTRQRGLFHRNAYSSRSKETQRRFSVIFTLKHYCRNFILFIVIFANFAEAVFGRPSAASLAADVNEALGQTKSPELGIQEINPILRHRYSSKIQERLKTLHDALSTIKNRNRQLQLVRANSIGRGIPLEYDGSVDDELTASVKNDSYRNTRNCFFSPLQCQLPYDRRMASLDENNKEDNNSNNRTPNTVKADATDTVISYQTELDSTEATDTKLEVRIGKMAEPDSTERLTVLAPTAPSATVMIKRRAAPDRRTQYRTRRLKPAKRHTLALRQWQALLVSNGVEGAQQAVLIETLRI